MPKSEILLLRRWPCWPGPYSRRLTGLLGRPKTFSPMRRSSLYLALVRFDIMILQFASSDSLEPHRRTDTRPARPPLHQGCGANCEGGHMATNAIQVNGKGLSVSS